MRGIFERPKGSGIWWISYFHQGVHHREKVGTHAQAEKLYIRRKADSHLGKKLPDLNRRAVTLASLIEDAIEYVRANNRTPRDYVSKGKVVKAALGHVTASALTPQELSRWLASVTTTPATFNRYKSFVSLCYREGIANGKVSVNPARLVRQKKESAGRLRFLTRDEANKVADELRGNRLHLAAFLLSLQTGMRLTEQFSLVWGQVHWQRRTIELTQTKNGSSRTVPLTSLAFDVLQELYQAQGAKERIFPSERKVPDVRPWFPDALDRAGIVGYSWHGNRHTFCSWHSMAGTSLKELQVLAGHKTIGMTARYAHLSQHHIANAAENIVGTAEVVSIATGRTA